MVVFTDRKGQLGLVETLIVGGETSLSSSLLGSMMFSSDHPSSNLPNAVGETGTSMLRLKTASTCKRRCFQKKSNSPSLKARSHRYLYVKLLH